MPMAVLAVLALLMISGVAGAGGVGTPAPVASDPPSVALDVPYVEQATDTCGAAALAMVLGYWGLHLPQAEIAAALLEKELHGIRGSRLEEFARARGFTAVAYTGDAEHLRAYVGKGRPLIVALSAGRGRFHNVVVVGFDRAREVLLVNDPARGAARPWAAREFEKRWAAAGHWTLLVLPAAP